MRKFIHENEKSKLVHDPLVARALLRRGCAVIDCKPLKNDRQRTVLVFKDTPKFRELLAELSKEWGDIEVETMEIVDPRMARALLKKGMTLVDYKESKVEDKTKMVFVFERNDDFDQMLEILTKEIDAKRESESHMDDLD